MTDAALEQISPTYALLMGLLAVFIASGLARFLRLPKTQGRLDSIDGLRGYLAFFVFIHHAYVWYFYLHYGAWSRPLSNFYNQLGKGSVAVFFMITGFCFSQKYSMKERNCNGANCSWVEY